MDLETIIRQEIRKRGISQHRICQDCRLDKAAIYRFMEGGGLKATTAGILLSYLGIELKIPAKKK